MRDLPDYLRPAKPPYESHHPVAYVVTGAAVASIVALLIWLVAA